MSVFLRSLLHPYLAPADDDGVMGGGSDTVTDLPDPDADPDADRGDALRDAKDEPLLETPQEGGDVDPEDPDADPKAKGKGKDSRIPLARHKDILAKEREQRQVIEQRLALYEKGREVSELGGEITKIEGQMLQMEHQYTKLLAEGELEKAAQLMSRIRQTERHIAETKADMKVAASVAQATEQARYNISLERIEEAYPELNPDDADSYDPDTMSEVAEFMQVYKQRGMTPTQALQKAVKRVLGSDTAKQTKALTVAPRVNEKDVAAERRKSGTARTLDATNRQPPSTARVGLDSDKAGGGVTARDVMKMSQDDFRKLPESVLSRMRGDTL
jgi:hypothetical protein